MSTSPEDWEKQLKEKPFDGTQFTPQMRRNVEEHLRIQQPKRFRSWGYAAVLLPLAVIILWLGYSSWEPGKSAESSIAAVTPAVTPAVNSQDNGMLEDAPGGSAHWSPKKDRAVGIASNYAATVSFPSSEEGHAEIALPLTAMFSVSALEGGETHETLPPLPDMTYPLPPDMEGKLQAALVFRADTGSAYILLAPAGWTASAITGANGSYGVTFEDPEDPQRTLQYSDNAWGCQGCAVGDIGTYIPGKADWAGEYGMTIAPKEFTRQQVMGTKGPDARTVRYTVAAEAKGDQADGAAYYEEGEWGYLFRKLELAAPPGSFGQDMIDTILSYFTTYHGPLLLPAVQNTESSAGGAGNTTESLYLALEQRGMRLSRVLDTEEHLFKKELAGRWPDELLIDKTDTPVRPDRLSVYTYDNAEECAAGLDALKLAINRTTYDGGARIYPHAFRGGKFLVVYWMGGDNAEPYQYDKAIKTALSSVDSDKE
ncbi:DUF4850 domain-containing protein [Paenibacillus sp. P46E]|uniref:DUF4850 domain-containing protein n=1 Tax=Paenibacillus sp. P46E TaxID=1349436 RepID=UPI00093A8DF9|nr:DUF4850 domain-containing protein [Paenibacillus sp. P46E]OKP94305.1 hypothetical protein A3849_30055 [Paenibacillus sp. P46E]